MFIVYVSTVTVTVYCLLFTVYCMSQFVSFCERRIQHQVSPVLA